MILRAIAADDEQYMRDAIPGIVPWDEWEISLEKVCRNGDELKRAIDDLHPDIVITDIRMPLMDGLEVCRYVYENYPDTEVIILSAYSDFSYARTALKYDVSEYILKTDVIEELPSAVERVAEKIRNNRQKKDGHLIRTSYPGERQTDGLPEATGLWDSREAAGDNDLFTAMQDHVEKHYKEDISLSELAKLLHANPSYLSRLYKEKAGKNLFDDIMDRKLSMAKELLRSSSMKINDIAEAVGFNDPGYFSRFFKKQTGVSPREYRAGDSDLN